MQATGHPCCMQMVVTLRWWAATAAAQVGVQCKATKTSATRAADSGAHLIMGRTASAVGLPGVMDLEDMVAGLGAALVVPPEEVLVGMVRQAAGSAAVDSASNRQFRNATHGCDSRER